MDALVNTPIVNRIGIAALLLGLVSFGCSPKVTGSQHQSREAGGVLVAVSVRPGLPQDSETAVNATGAQVGDNTLTVELRDDKTNAPIGDANVTAAPASDLVGQQRGESGRSQGNGIYLVPIRFGVPDKYTVIVTIDRPGRSETSAQFSITAN
jgi:hypothetical protein